ncbi:quinone-dependent dihydroorotate dehydrogenase [Nocardiopsis ansamitocini]|uniref:Dihydroorotate dehydrogenase (quinone) n=1 Tax=Nocardiopsis ansamitocini TaxID=1670832 RepID=A0A9W6UH40_9ACTN|nr:quinone-dependent dihydroorotate dehydrogenase [Nocardiopsis ansamitocini]GLU46219.1 dihydroorotate dehydrogenase (quinone) [Nocardiopsis ansamitocini]
MLYQLFFHAVLRRTDAEQIHRLSFAGLRAVAAVPGATAAMNRVLAPRAPELAVRALGRDFAGPLGMAAGFDKNAEGAQGLSALGFSHVEIGTVTARPQPGNPAPRLFRLVADRAIVNRMGFNNDGSEAVAARLRVQRAGGARGLIIGANIGKTKIVPESEAVADYVASARRFADIADYVAVNVSSPNTPGLRDLQAVEHLRPLLAAVRATLDEQGRPELPLLVKIAPDLADTDIDAVADLALELGLHGIIATNTTISRADLATPEEEVEAVGAGGLSGAPLKARSLQVLRRLRARVGDRLLLVAVGGIETPEDAWARIRSGATLVQGYTGLIYGGPLWPSRIHRGLVRLARKDGYARVADAIGVDVDDVSVQPVAVH